MALSEVFGPLLTLSEIFTMSPFTLENGKKLNFVTRKKGLFYTFRLFLLLIFVVFCVVYIQFVKNIYDLTSVIAISVQFAHYNFRIPSTILCLLLTNYSNSKTLEFLNSIVEIDHKFRELGFVVCYKKTKKLVRIMVFVTILEQFLQQLPYYFFHKFYNTLENALDFLLSNIPMVLIQILILHWILYQHILMVHFKALNRILKTLKYRQCWVVDDFGNAQKFPSVLAVLKSCGVLYDKLCVLSRKINDAFAWQILFLIPSIFLVIIYSSFNICQMIKSKRPFDLKTVIFNLVFFASFLEFVLPCVMTKDESEKFLDNLHKVDTHCGQNDEMDELMNALTLQTYHQKVEFSAHGVFPLDGTLIYSIFGALTTYLVILLQFDV